MMKTSERFEQQIERIHSLIEQKGSIVTWDDHIPDPDNPSQPRQIDVTIRRDNSLTLIECRIHKAAQDVKWIEELIGRRISLHANLVIAVSNSGFTKGAILKAKSHGIILRDFKSLTEEEISHWGHKTRSWISFHKFSNIQMIFAFDKATVKNRITANDIWQYIKVKGRIFSIIEPIIGELGRQNRDEGPFRIVTDLHPGGLHDISGAPLKVLLFQADYKVIKQEIYVSSVVAYDTPDVDPLEREVFVEEVAYIPNFEITQSSNTVSVAMDFSQIKVPLNARFHHITFDFKRPVRLKSLYILGDNKLFFKLSNPKIMVVYE